MNNDMEAALARVMEPLRSSLKRRLDELGDGVALPANFDQGRAAMIPVLGASLICKLDAALGVVELLAIVVSHRTLTAAKPVAVAPRW